MFLTILLNIFFVGFTDKTNSQPISFTERALEQRQRWSIPSDSLDYAVRHDYIDSILDIGAHLCYTTRWFNGIVVKTEDTLALRIKQYPFVRTVQKIRDTHPSTSTIRAKKNLFLSSENTSPLKTTSQLEEYNLLPLHEAGYEGQGILLTVCDVGFQGFDTMPNLHRENCLGKYNLTDDADSINDNRVVHGTYCLSTIVGEQEGYKGSATRVQYYIMRSEEIETESPKELYNLVAAMEKSDSLGVNIFSCSLGYCTFDNPEWSYSYSDLDGQTTIATQGAQIAARKGMLLCISAGNSGNDSWHYLYAPSDADSILCVGAVDTLGQIASFSSYGPSSDGRIKPDVCAVGQQTCLLSPNGGITMGNGTSFACPLMAGMAASLWSAHPQESAMQIRQRILESTDRYTNPDEHYGYGIPNAWQASQDLPNSTQRCLTTTTTTKLLQHGQLLIIRDKIAYDILGRKHQ